MLRMSPVRGVGAPRALLDSSTLEDARGAARTVCTAAFGSEGGQLHREVWQGRSPIQIRDRLGLASPECCLHLDGIHRNAARQRALSLVDPVGSERPVQLVHCPAEGAARGSGRAIGPERRPYGFTVRLALDGHVGRQAGAQAPDGKPANRPPTHAHRRQAEYPLTNGDHPAISENGGRKGSRSIDAAYDRAP
jgi:hypothetical protein